MKIKNATVFLGGGRITSAMCAGLRLAGDRRLIVVYDRVPGKLRALRREAGIEIVRTLKSAVERADLLMVAVRPGSVKELLAEIEACGAKLPRACVSFAAGIPLAQVRESGTSVGQKTHWVRAMPSPVCRMAKGLTALCFDHGFPEGERKRVRDLFQAVGPVIEIPEPQFDAFTATYSSSHGYHALRALAGAAEQAGLDRKTALMAAAHGLGDGIAYWRQSGSSLDELLEEAATPGGTAAATMAAMEKAGYGRAVKKGIEAGVRQARKNAGTAR